MDGPELPSHEISAEIDIAEKPILAADELQASYQGKP